MTEQTSKVYEDTQKITLITNLTQYPNV